ncbi:hypothetical protein B0H16DRAFT_1859400 [Mycena metata]|uniref:Uncharacterized protein n=1 Tax=Mycena metata TaxID=1033252 RepID=A0AAD7NV75_9AGAR|nr:hypothetical protein B0H16DRAFT_1859400 [Mycena metata]
MFVGQTDFRANWFREAKSGHYYWALAHAFIAASDLLSRKCPPKPSDVGQARILVLACDVNLLMVNGRRTPRAIGVSIHFPLWIHGFHPEKRRIGQTEGVENEAEPQSPVIPAYSHDLEAESPIPDSRRDVDARRAFSSQRQLRHLWGSSQKCHSAHRKFTALQILAVLKGNRGLENFIHPRQIRAMTTPHTIQAEYDLIFAGGGTAACIIAGRLATALMRTSSRWARIHI